MHSGNSATPRYGSISLLVGDIHTYTDDKKDDDATGHRRLAGAAAVSVEKLSTDCRRGGGLFCSTPTDYLVSARIQKGNFLKPFWINLGIYVFVLFPSYFSAECLLVLAEELSSAAVLGTRRRQESPSHSKFGPTAIKARVCVTTEEEGH